MSTSGGLLVIAEVLPYDHPDSGGTRDAALTEGVVDGVTDDPIKPDAPAKVLIEFPELAVEDGKIKTERRERGRGRRSLTDELSSKIKGSSLSRRLGEEPTGGVALGIAVNKDDTV